MSGLVLLLLSVLVGAYADIVTNDIQNAAFIPPSSASTIRNGQIVLINKTAHAAGAVWFTQKQNMQYGFTASFDFVTTDDCPGDCALEGLALVFQNSNISAVGTNGSSLGYGGIPDSLAIELDFIADPNVANSFCNSQAHIGFLYQYQKYSVKNSPDHDYSGYTSCTGFDDANVRTVSIIYDSINTKLYFSGASASGTASMSGSFTFNFNYAINSDYTWVGFTAGTSTKAGSVAISAFEFRERCYIQSISPSTSAPYNGVVQMQVSTIRNTTQAVYCFFGTKRSNATIISVDTSSNIGTISCVCTASAGTSVSITASTVPTYDSSNIAMNYKTSSTPAPKYKLNLTSINIRSISASGCLVDWTGLDNSQYGLTTYYNISIKVSQSILTKITLNTSYLITGLVPLYQYTISVCACVDYSACGQATILSFVTSPGPPYVLNNTYPNVVIGWDTSPLFVSYKILLQDYSTNLTLLSNATAPPFSFFNLTPSSEYGFAVIANSGTYGPTNVSEFTKVVTDRVHYTSKVDMHSGPVANISTMLNVLWNATITPAPDNSTLASVICNITVMDTLQNTHFLQQQAQGLCISGSAIMPNLTSASIYTAQMRLCILDDCSNTTIPFITAPVVSVADVTGSSVDLMFPSRQSVSYNVTISTHALPSSCYTSVCDYPGLLPETQYTFSVVAIGALNARQVISAPVTLSISTIGMSNFTTLIQITAISSADTQGGNVYIAASNFAGTDVSSFIITLGGVSCKNPQVDVYNATITCYVGGGVGAGKNVSISAGTQPVVFDITPGTTFSYNPPMVNETDSIPLKGGWITIIGTNFGADSSQIDLYTLVGNDQINCTNVTIVQPDFKVACWAPTQSSDHSVYDYNLTISIAGQGLVIPQLKFEGCGDGTCQYENGEDCANCMFDCPPCVCGNNVTEGTEQCDGGESCINSACECPDEYLPNGSNGCIRMPCPATSDGICSGTDHGECVSGQCICNSTWTGPACEYSCEYIDVTCDFGVVTLSIPAEDSSNSSITFQLFVQNITEIAPNNSIIADFHDFNFQLVDQSPAQANYSWWTYNATLQNGAVVTITYYYFQNGTMFPVLGNYTWMSDNTLKYNLDIDYWPFANVNSRLNITVRTNTNATTSESACANYRTQQYGCQNATLWQEATNTDGYTLYTQFSQQALVDNVLKNVNAYIENDDIVIIQTPFFWERVSIDPKYTVLLDTTLVNDDPQCAGSAKHKLHMKLKLAIIIVIVVVGTMAVTAVSVVIFRYRVSYKKKLDSSDESML